MRKLMIILMGLSLMQCSGGGSSVSTRNFNNANDLSSALSGNSFQLSVEQDCSSSSSADSVSSAGSSDTTYTDQNYVAYNWGDSWSTNESDVEFVTGYTSPAASVPLSNGMVLRFSNLTVELIDGSETVATGTWEAVDSDTIQIVIDGQTINTDVVVYSDGTIELEYVNNLVTSSCSGAVSEVSTNSLQTQESSRIASLFSNFGRAGTWCYESGTPYFLSLRISNDEAQNIAVYINEADPHIIFQVALPNDNVEAFRAGFMDLIYTEKAARLNADNELRMPTESDVVVTGIDDEALIDFDSRADWFTLYFGSGLSATYSKLNGRGSLYEDCEGLDSRVTLADLQTLGYVL